MLILLSLSQAAFKYCKNANINNIYDYTAVYVYTFSGEQTAHSFTSFFHFFHDLKSLNLAALAIYLTLFVLEHVLAFSLNIYLL